MPLVEFGRAPPVARKAGLGASLNAVSPFTSAGRRTPDKPLINAIEGVGFLKASSSSFVEMFSRLSLSWVECFRFPPVAFKIARLTERPPCVLALLFNLLHGRGELVNPKSTHVLRLRSVSRGNRPSFGDLKSPHTRAGAPPEGPAVGSSMMATTLDFKSSPILPPSWLAKPLGGGR
jgi:hypothetical protein